MQTPNSSYEKHIPDALELSKRRDSIIGVLENTGDYYLQNSVTKPKADIASYLENQGFLVPKRYSGLDEALKSGKPFIIRSEHPVEYYGAAGIHESYKILDPTKVYINKRGEGIEHPINIMDYSQEELENILVHIEKKFPRYAQLSHIPVDQYFSLLSYSYRELLSGYNCSIIADSAVVGRYHMFTTGTCDFHKGYHNYLVIDEGQITINGAHKATPEIANAISENIDMYNNIRKLSKFNSNHCPIIEFQRVNNNNYFLQYHRTRDEDFADFVLDETKYDDYVSAGFVRGKTSREGHIYTISAEPSNASNELPSMKYDGAIIQGYSVAVHEYLSRKHKIISDLNDIDMMLYKTENMHLPKSQMFNSDIFINIGNSNIIDKYKKMLNEYFSAYYSKDKDSGETIIPDVYLTIKVISDGKKALIKCLE